MDVVVQYEPRLPSTNCTPQHTYRLHPNRHRPLRQWDFMKELLRGSPGDCRACQRSFICVERPPSPFLSSSCCDLTGSQRQHSNNNEQVRYRTVRRPSTSSHWASNKRGDDGLLSAQVHLDSTQNFRQLWVCSMSNFQALLIF